MTTLNLLKVCFDMPIQHRELVPFKAALMRRLQTQTHLSERYPLLQFKTRFQKDGLRPMLMVLGKKIAALRHPFLSAPLRLPLQGREKVLTVSDFRSLAFPLRTDRGFHTYNLFKYHAFNQEHFRMYTSLSEPEEQRAFLADVLQGHLEAFVKGVGWVPDPPIIVKDIHVKQEEILNCPEYKPHCFDLRFRTNLWIPEYIGLGKRVSLGFGVLRLPRKQ